MPELPDLQVFSINLTKLLAEKKVREVRVIKSKKLNVPQKKLKEALEGQSIKKVIRAGKELHFVFGNDNILALHLMLRGKLHYYKGTHEERFPVIELIFSDKSGLVMTDFQGQATPTLNPEKHDGIDALSKEVNYKFLRDILSGSKASVKNLLLDQHIIRGIGNAYVDEILWKASISPFSISNKIPDGHVRALAKAIPYVLGKAEKEIIKHDPKIISGEIRDFLNIHNSKKKTSPGGKEIKVHESGSRKTYYTDEQQLFS